MVRLFGGGGGEFLMIRQVRIPGPDSSVGIEHLTRDSGGLGLNTDWFIIISFIPFQM